MQVYSLDEKRRVPVVVAKMSVISDASVIAIHGTLISVQVHDLTMVVTARRKLQWEGGQPNAARLVVGAGLGGLRGLEGRRGRPRL